MKLLIIDNSVLGHALKLIFEQHGEILLSSHEDALENFLLEEPDRILICECWESTDSKSGNVGKITAEDIYNSADQTVIIKTIGFDAMAFGKPCDISISPLSPEEILKSLQIRDSS